MATFDPLIVLKNETHVAFRDVERGRPFMIVDNPNRVYVRPELSAGSFTSEEEENKVGIIVASDDRKRKAGDIVNFSMECSCRYLEIIRTPQYRPAR